MQNYWHKQTQDKPLFPDLLWSRPENKQLAGKLLIIGGNAHGFVAPAEAFRAAEASGIGVAKMILPDSLRQFVGKPFTAGELASSTPSGSFARQSLAVFLELADWADGVMIAGDLGHNSETAIVLEQFVKKYSGPLTITKDAVDYFTKAPATIMNRTDTTLVLSLAQLQQIAQAAHFILPITFGMDLLHLVEALHEFSQQFAANIVVKHLENIFVAVGGQVSSSRLPKDIEVWRVPTAAHAVVWWLQNPSRVFEALTTSILEHQPA